jgi:hypothetical protein
MSRTLIALGVLVAVFHGLPISAQELAGETEKPTNSVFVVPNIGTNNNLLHKIQGNPNCNGGCKAQYDVCVSQSGNNQNRINQCQRNYNACMFGC